MEYKQSKIGLVPKEWTLTKLKNIALKITDGTHDTPNKLDKGVPFITALHVKDGSINFDECYFVSMEDHQKIYNRCNPEKGDLLLVNIGAGTATPALVRIDYEFSLKNVALIKPNPNIVDSTYLEAFQLYRKNNLFNRITTGGAQPFLALKDIGNLDIILPTLAEQQKIASILTTWDKKIELVEKLIEQKEEQKKGLMQNLLIGEVRFPNFKGDWEEVKLNGIIRELVNKSTTNNQYELLSVTKNGIVSQSEHFNKQVASEENTGYKIVRKNNLVFSTMNLWMGSLDVLTNKEIGIVSPAYKVFEFTDKLVPLFGKYFMKSNYMIWIYKYNSEQGASVVRRNLDLKGLLNTVLRIPSKEEQSSIAKVLSILDQEIKLLIEELGEINKIKRGLMQNLLTGKVRVKV